MESNSIPNGQRIDQQTKEDVENLKSPSIDSEDSELLRLELKDVIERYNKNLSKDIISHELFSLSEKLDEGIDEEPFSIEIVRKLGQLTFNEALKIKREVKKDKNLIELFHFLTS